MILLLLGIVIWMGAHLFKRLAPERRAVLGEPGKGLVAGLLVLALVLIVLGYRWAPFIPVWFPPDFMWHVNNVLMVFAVWVFGSSQFKGAKVWPATKWRHPQLTSVKIWAVAHLLVNGDLASIILFGAMLGWAVVEVIVINRSEPDWTPPPPAPARKRYFLAAITIVAFVVIAGIHIWLGVSPFPT